MSYPPPIPDKTPATISNKWDIMDLPDQIKYMQAHAKRLNSYYNSWDYKTYPPTNAMKNKLLCEIVISEQQVEKLKSLARMYKINIARATPPTTRKEK